MPVTYVTTKKGTSGNTLDKERNKWLFISNYRSFINWLIKLPVRGYLPTSVL